MAKSKRASAVPMLTRTSCPRHEPSLPKGIGINKVAKAVGLGVGTVAKLKNEMLKAEMAAAA
jgi:hypothetical protein